MSQSVTVLSGASNGSISGLVTIPLNIQASITSSLQTLLNAESASVAAGQIVLNNVNVIAGGISGSYTASTPGGSGGLIEFTNTDANGSVHGGSTSFSTNLPPGYSTLIDQAPNTTGGGNDVIRGNSSQNFLAIFGSNTPVTFVPEGGSGTIIAGGSNSLFSTNGTWSIIGSTVGGDSIAGNGTTIVDTFGQGSSGGANGTSSVNPTPSNVVGLLGGSATVNAGGTDDLVEGYSQTTDIVSVSGSSVTAASADILVSGGAVTVYAGPYSSNVEAFFETGGSLYFVNQTSVQAFVTGDVAGATGGSATVFGGTGGGVFTGGTGGFNSLVGGFAPGQSSTAGGAGLVTLIGGGSSNNFLEATGSLVGGGNTQNLLIAGGTGSVAGGSATLVATGTTSVNTFNTGNALSAVVSSSGAGRQTYNLITGGYNETVTGSTAATATNLFIVNESSTSASNTDVITNFSLSNGKDTISVTGGAVVANVTSITGGTGGTLFTLNDGTQIKLLGVTYNSSYNSTYDGKTTI